MAKKRPIKYTSRDFNSIKRDIEDYARRYYPDTYKDFSEASFGSLMVDSVAYVGDILSYYLDYNVNESFFDTCIEYNNVIRHARTLGYKYAGRPTSSGIAAFFIVVPALATGAGPDSDYIPILKAGTSLTSNGGVGFILTENVNFKDSGNQFVVARVDTTTGLPTFYAIKAYGRIMSGNYKTTTITVGTFERFRKIYIKDKNITEIISVTDSDGNEYFEVAHLSQNVIYKEFMNPNFQTDNTPSIIKPIVVARRFSMERDSYDSAYLQFGYGSEEDVNINNVADPSNVVINSIGKDYVTDVNFDPYKLLNTDKFGVGPTNTTLTIVYRSNSAANVNVGANAITTVSAPIIEFKASAGLITSKKTAVVTSLECGNEEPIIGDVTQLSVDEIRIRAKDHFATQERAVTDKDYEAIIYSMPDKYGSIKRCRVLKDSASFRKNINIYLISEDSNGYLTQTTDSIKTNLKTWLGPHKVLNDTIDLLDAHIINLGIEFTVRVGLDMNKHEVLQTCTNILAQEYSVNHMIGQPFASSRIWKLLNKIDGVDDVLSVEIVQRIGSNYSGISFPIDSMKSPDGRYIMAPKNVVFEVKYPTTDIRGSVE
tara:strand:- start:10853 stop:12646 length:1794 start_codon:yes stop_codon:yes gene_type:complete